MKTRLLDSSPTALVLKMAMAMTILAVGAGSVGASENPPAPGFDLTGSDPRAIEVADRVMESMGGRESWDSTRYLAWNFFGIRDHVWDRWTGELRYEPPNMVVLMNVHSREGRAWKDGKEIEDPQELEKVLRGAYEAWINDSYWLLMPYKLKDSGVTLEYVGEGELENGRPAHVLQLTFEDVGVTPQNKYHVFVDKEEMLVRQWSFFPTRDAKEPRFTTPWDDWTRHGDILLSGDRGERQLNDIRVFDGLPASVFESPEPIDLSAFE